MAFHARDGTGFALFQPRNSVASQVRDRPRAFPRALPRRRRRDGGRIVSARVDVAIPVASGVRFFSCARHAAVVADDIETRTTRRDATLTSRPPPSHPAD